jgi:hypothetical protein
MTRREGLLVLGGSLVGAGAALFASIWQAGVGLLVVGAAVVAQDANKIGGDAEHPGRR